MPIRKLNPDEYNNLANAYSDAKDADENQTNRCGNHFVLIFILQKLGFSARGSEQAEALAERILNAQ